MTGINNNHNDSALIAYGIMKTGGADMLCQIDQPLAPLAMDEVRIRQTAVGLNFIDIYQRAGLYPVPMPAVLGLEATGVIEAMGANVKGFNIGNRVGYCGALGAYCTIRNIKADKLILLPDGIEDHVLAASLLRGMTAEYLLNRTYKVQKGDYVLFHAAAGGVGQIALQWLSRIGAKTIGVVSTPQKAEIAKACGADHVIIGRNADIAAEVREITKGAMVKVVYDSVGKATYLASLNSLAPRGMFVTFGNASGPVPAIEPSMLAQRGSLFVTRPSLANYTLTPQELLDCSNSWFAMLKSGLKVNIGQKWKLSEVADAHRALESGTTTGASVLIP